MPRLKGNSAKIAKDKILKKIENYELLTGDVVSDLELSKEFGMSRTPIREAIMSLIENNILERTKTKVVVKVISLSDIIEILQVREAIEQKAAEIIIKNNGLTKEQQEELLRIHEDLCQNISNGNFDSNFDADDNFHKKIVEYSCNSRFLDIYKRLRLQVLRLRWITMLTPSRYAETREEHKKIIEGLINSNLELTKQAIQEHLQNTQLNYEKILKDKQWIKISKEIKNISDNTCT